MTLIRERARGASVYGVLKGNAYGLGIVDCARVLRDEGVRRFAVGDPADGALLRREGFTDEEILLLRSTSLPEEIDALLDAGLVATIGSRDAALALSGLAERRSTVAEAHICVDTGLGRDGFLPPEIDKILSVYRYMPNLALSGVYTHIGGYNGARAVMAQMQEFRSVVERIAAEQFEPGILHIGGSTALFSCNLPSVGAVRVGGAVTGRIPGKHGLQKVGLLEAVVTEVIRRPKGFSVGSSHPVRLRRDSVLALVPVGVADGLCVGRTPPKTLFAFRPGKTLWASVGQAKARVVGNVGLGHVVLDITGLSCTAGDRVYFDCNPLFAPRLPRKYV